MWRKSLTTAAGKRVIVLDTSAFVAGFDPFSIGEEQYTVPMVREEVVGSTITRIRFKTAVESRRLKVQTPEKIFVDKVKASAAAVGDASSLSETDIQVLALALQLKMQNYTPLVATDDYSIQNVARHLGIGVASLATFGIRSMLKWVRYCPACHKKYPSDYKSKRCQVCGTELKRKPLRKTSQKTKAVLGEM